MALWLESKASKLSIAIRDDVLWESAEELNNQNPCGAKSKYPAVSFYIC